MSCKKIYNQINIIDDNITIKNLISNIIDTGIEEGFLICDIKAMVQQHFYFKKALPRVKTFYAVKCNPDKMILSVLAALGVSFDCASLGEIKLILSLKVDPKRILYALPTKPLSHLRFASENKVSFMTFDHEFELVKIKNINPNAELLLRIKADSHKATVVFGKKFGCDPEIDAPRILQTAFEMGMNIVGVCFNVGTICEEPEAYYRGIEKARMVFDAAMAIGFQMNVLDVGGGFPYETPASIDPIAHKINCAIDGFFPADQFGNLRIIAEPGRYYVTPALTIACQIHLVKSERDESDNETFSYYITDGIYGSFQFLGLGKKKFTPYTLKETNQELYSCTIYGPTCDSRDKIVSNYFLPKLSFNDWICCSNFGAYTIAAKSNFNGFAVSQSIYVCERSMARYLSYLDSLRHFFIENKKF